MALHRRRFSRTPRRSASPRARRLRLEPLEQRCLLAATPYGAQVDDTAEFMLGRIAVTPVFLESSGAVQSQDWTAQQIEETKDKLLEAGQWWSDTLAALNTVHSLDWVFDFSYADTPVETTFEPIDGSSDSYALWVDQFLDFAGYNTPASVHDDIRAFNDAQRQAHDAHWAFTVIVVDSDEDPDGRFASGAFSRAFAFAGGRMVIAPSTRPASTFAHEFAHMFWAKDEYVGGGSWLDQRGYYDAQNFNAADNDIDGFVQQPSLMAAGSLLQTAWDNHLTSESSMAMIGWRDSDQDGVFDVLDVPHQLQASGVYDPAAASYRLVGQAQVGTLPNRNSSGLQSDITINEADQLQYRVDGGTWLTAAAFDQYAAQFDVTVPLAAGSSIEFRTVTIDDGTAQIVASSNVFAGDSSGPSTTATPGISGFVWRDSDSNGDFDADEQGVANHPLLLLDDLDQPLVERHVEPDDYGDNDVLNHIHPDVVLTAEGWSLTDDSVISRSRPASTGGRVFGFFLGPNVVAAEFIAGSRELVMTFNSPVSRVALDAVANSDNDIARLEVYDADDNLLQRYTTSLLPNGAVETMSIVRPQADIAYAKAYGHQGTAVRLDHLRFGPQIEAQTDSQGAYFFSGLEGGAYTVQVSTPGTWLPTSPSSGRQSATLSNGEARQEVDFGITAATAWQNPDDRFDVDGDGLVNSSDLVILLGDMIINGARLLPDPGQNGPPPFLDVTGDGSFLPDDLADVIVRMIQDNVGEPVGGEGEAAAAPRSVADDPDAAAPQAEAEPSSIAAPTPAVEPPVGLRPSARAQRRRWELFQPSPAPPPEDAFFAELGRPLASPVPRLFPQQDPAPQPEDPTQQAPTPQPPTPARRDHLDRQLRRLRSEQPMMLLEQAPEEGKPGLTPAEATTDQLPARRPDPALRRARPGGSDD